MENRASCIQVEDASGCRFHLHEYRRRPVLFGARRYVLVETGEPVRRVDEATFVIATTGEPLVQVRPLAADLHPSAMFVRIGGSSGFGTKAPLFHSCAKHWQF